MFNRSIPSSLLIAGILSLTAADAYAVEPCFGDWQFAAQIPRPGQPLKEWGEPSTCSCGIGTRVDGGVYVSSQRVGWLWSEGYGEVRLQLEVERDGKPGDFLGIPTKVKKAEYVDNVATRKPFVGKNGGGTDGAISLPDGAAWTGKFRVVCFPGS